MALLKADPSNCSQEPIHIPGRIQPHGILLALSVPDWVIRHASANVEAVLGQSAGSLVGERLDSVLAGKFVAELRQELSVKDVADLNPLKARVEMNGSTVPFDAIAHWSGDLLILELEKASDPEDDVSFSNVYRKINSATSRMGGASSVAELCRITAEQAKKLSGFHRVMIYRFDEDWNGSVLAESREPHQEPFLGLRYPASDIPAQARALYRLNWIRSIPDVAYQPVDIVPATRAGTREPLDLSFSVLRSVSPMHLQYLKNMGVGASMSVSVIVNQELWGLIAFHHENARYLPYELRRGLEFVGKHFSLQLAARERHENLEYKQALKALQPRLHESMRRSADFLDGLHGNELSFLELAEGAHGGAIAHRGKVRLVGATPPQEQIEGLVAWLKKRVGQTPVFKTTSLAAEYEPAQAFKDVASGLLCLSVPEPDPSYVLWFKPEVIQTVNWSGNPEKPVEITDGGAKLSPRRSFALWQETVRLRSLPWAREEIEAAEELRRSIIEVDLERQVVSAVASNEELEQYAHVIAHDLKEPLRGIRNLAGFLEKDAIHKLTPAETDNLRDISDLAEKGRKLITELYEYSRLGRVELALAATDLNEVVSDIRARLVALLKESQAEVKVLQSLPTLHCDRVRVAEVFGNLIVNAVKYNDSPKKRVEVGVQENPSAASVPVLFVRDNGIGIEPQDQARVFRIFERLHAPETFGGGTGSGLAIAKRIIDRHSGRIWLESEPGRGTTFFFTLAPATASKGPQAT